jgi:hypothetical protein
MVEPSFPTQIKVLDCEEYLAALAELTLSYRLFQHLNCIVHPFLGEVRTGRSNTMPGRIIN